MDGLIRIRRVGVRSRARAAEDVPVPWRMGVACQRWSPWGFGKRWFEVELDERRDQAQETGQDAVAAQQQIEQET